MSYLSYLSPVAHEISSRRRQICRRVLHGYFHPICRRIASECMMVISSGQCVFVVSLFIDSGSVLFLPIVDTGHWPLTRDTWRVETTPQLQLTAADAGCRYGETDTVMCVVINVVTGVQCNLCSDVPLDILQWPRPHLWCLWDLVQCTRVWV